VRAAGVALVAAVIVAGCGSSSSPSNAGRGSAAALPREVSHVSLRTRGGFRYTASLTSGAAGECLEESFELTGHGVEPYDHYTRACVSGIEPAGPLLIQVLKPRTAVILDRPAGGCSAVRVGHARAATVCSAGKPVLRVTTLPARGGAVSVSGIAGVMRVKLRIAQRCKHVCQRRL
jgi:hypothetical protein